MAKYRYRLDERHYLEAARKHNRRRFSWYFGPILVTLIALMFLVATLHTAVTEGECVPAVMTTVLILYILCVRRVAWWRWKNKLRKWLLYKEETEFTLPPGGVHITTPKSDFTFDWQWWVKARRVRSGFLLYEDPHSSFWLSDDSLVEGTVEDVDALFRENIADYKPMRKGEQ